MGTTTDRSPCGSGGCLTCPFSCSMEAEQAQGYGCLPDSFDIIKIKENSGHNWSCHGDTSVVCGGLARYITRKRPDLSLEGGLIDFDAWNEHGMDKAIQIAEEKYNNGREKGIKTV